MSRHQSQKRIKLNLPNYVDSDDEEKDISKTALVDPFASNPNTVVLDDVSILKSTINNATISNSIFQNSAYFQRGYYSIDRGVEYTPLTVTFPIQMASIPAVFIQMDLTNIGVQGLRDVPGPNGNSPYITTTSHSVFDVTTTSFRLSYFVLRYNFGDVVADHYALCKAEGTDGSAAHKEAIEMFYQASKIINFWWMAIVM